MMDVDQLNAVFENELATKEPHEVFAIMGTHMQLAALAAKVLQDRGSFVPREHAAYFESVVGSSMGNRAVQIEEESANGFSG